VSALNLDFHAIPQRGEEAVLEKHYVSKRSRRERAVLVFLAQDSDTRVSAMPTLPSLKRLRPMKSCALWNFGRQHGQPPPLLIFDSRLTTYQH